MENSFCAAYFGDGKFLGWYGDTFGTISTVPKLYSNRSTMIDIISTNFTNKCKNGTQLKDLSFTNPGSNLITNSLKADFRELSQYKTIELKFVDCPYYDGPDPTFDYEKYNKESEERKSLWKNREQEEGLLAGPSIQREKALEKFNLEYPKPTPPVWFYADCEQVKSWAKIEPTEFFHITTFQNN